MFFSSCMFWTRYFRKRFQHMQYKAPCICLLHLIFLNVKYKTCLGLYMIPLGRCPYNYRWIAPCKIDNRKELMFSSWNFLKIRLRGVEVTLSIVRTIYEYPIVVSLCKENINMMKICRIIIPKYFLLVRGPSSVINCALCLMNSVDNQPQQIWFALCVHNCVALECIHFLTYCYISIRFKRYTESVRMKLFLLMFTVSFAGYSKCTIWSNSPSQTFLKESMLLSYLIQSNVI